MNVNREYKNSVFIELFNDHDKLLELYSALSGSDYNADIIIDINTLDDVLFMNMINDISFTIGDKIVVLVEHQSTISENLPIRFLLYIARIYEKIIDKKTIYHQKVIKIPTPEFIVLYNGKEEFPNEKTYNLSDAFIVPPKPPELFGSLEIRVRVININAGYNENIINRSATLHGYVSFIHMVRSGINRGLSLTAAINEAIKYCEENNILQPFLSDHASEVINMLTTEFNMEDAIAVWKEEGREEGRVVGLVEGREEGRVVGLVEGREEGRNEERKDMAYKLKKARITSIEQIALITGLSIDEVNSL